MYRIHHQLDHIRPNQYAQLSDIQKQKVRSYLQEVELLSENPDRFECARAITESFMLNCIEMRLRKYDSNYTLRQLYGDKYVMVCWCGKLYKVMESSRLDAIFGLFLLIF